ncbi:MULTISPECIES: proteasome subunit alpha [Natrialbaceae]|uniref:proteasome subunit alpha n=1 Tax=Natrialbaceae TaxID=1644061 RepID=UPI00207CD068|nr:proteasome subunit alpha [Natronococcus sp. CG52]
MREPLQPPETDNTITNGRAPVVDADADDRIVKTGTTTLGAVAVDGAVLAADSRASLGGQFVTNRTAQKIEPIDDRTAVAFAGSVSDAQSFVRQLRAEVRGYEMRHERPMSVETMSTVAGDLVRRGSYRILDPVLAGVDDEPAVYDIGPGGGVMRTDYAASGSGMQLAYGVLENSYEPDATVEELRDVAVSAVHGATERDTASGDGMTVAAITESGIDLERFDDLEAAVATTNETPDGAEEVA